jgi:hypothetical protein
MYSNSSRERNNVINFRDLSPPKIKNERQIISEAKNFFQKRWCTPLSSLSKLTKCTTQPLNHWVSVLRGNRLLTLSSTSGDDIKSQYFSQHFFTSLFCEVRRERERIL